MLKKFYVNNLIKTGNSIAVLFCIGTEVGREGAIETMLYISESF